MYTKEEIQKAHQKAKQRAALFNFTPLRNAWKKKASDSDILEKTDKFLKHLQHDEKK
jgi:hypothetical protein